MVPDTPQYLWYGYLCEHHDSVCELVAEEPGLQGRGLAVDNVLVHPHSAHHAIHLPQLTVSSLEKQKITYGTYCVYVYRTKISICDTKFLRS